MSKKQTSLVYYYIPEDNDDPDYPNVFGILINKQNLRLQHIYDHFPLKGSYIFRFKVMYENAIAWLDLPDLQTKLPTYKDKIMIKATRISWENHNSNLYGHYRSNGINHSPKHQTKSEKEIPRKVEAPKMEINANLLDEKQQNDLI